MGGWGVSQEEGNGVVMERITQEETAELGRLALRDPAQALGFLQQNRGRFKGGSEP